MSLEILEKINKDNKSSNSDFDDFDKKSLANSISIPEQTTNEPLFNTESKDNIAIQTEEKNLNRDLSSNNSNNSNAENNIINLGGNSCSASDENLNEKENNLINNNNNKKEMNKSSISEKSEKSENLENYLTQLDSFDKKFSKKIHDLTLPRNLEYFIYFFARMFNPDFITSYLIVILSYKYYTNEALFILRPLLSTLATLIFSLFLKKKIGRPRPIPSKISKRIVDLRQHEKNCSMPSGDSIQAGNWAVLIYLYLDFSFGFLFVPLVMFARIYYYCHYLFDTIVGAILGSFISLLINIVIIYFI